MGRHAKVGVSLDISGARSEIYTVGKNLNSASFDVNKKFLRLAYQRDLNFEII